jgi:hypothetical protein
MTNRLTDDNLRHDQFQISLYPSFTLVLKSRMPITDLEARRDVLAILRTGTR